jgi:hypothetical protein
MGPPDAVAVGVLDYAVGGEVEGRVGYEGVGVDGGVVWVAVRALGGGVGVAEGDDGRGFFPGEGGLFGRGFCGEGCGRWCQQCVGEE